MLLSGNISDVYEAETGDKWDMDKSCSVYSLSNKSFKIGRINKQTRRVHMALPTAGVMPRKASLCQIHTMLSHINLKSNNHVIFSPY